VLAASPHSISNNGVARHRDTALLQSLTGPAGTVLFDESHLGMVETGTVMGLARHYHLQGLLGGLLVLFLLFVWRNWTAFPPRAELGTAVSATVDPLDGLAGLLARALPENRLIEECVRARTHTERNPQWHTAMETAAKSAGSKGPAELFRSIQSAIARRKMSDTKS